MLHIAALLGIGAQPSSLQCVSRGCLAEEDGSTLCFTNTGETESYAQCTSAEAPFCTRCTTGPPCESRCEAEAAQNIPLGSFCHLDRECGSDDFVSCYLGVCRELLWAGQACSSNATHTACIYGRQQCVAGYCEGFGTNEKCWDGYPGGLDLDCKVGWYCLRGVCVPQLPRGHTCHGEHPNECSRGHRCNLLSERPQCILEYSLPDGSRSNEPSLCSSSYVSPRTEECAPPPPSDNEGGDCATDEECVRSDGSHAKCLCKRWWSGTGVPGFCELHLTNAEKPSSREFWKLRSSRCHHDWPEERCAKSMGAEGLLRLVRREREVSADPTLPIPSCAHQLFDIQDVVGRAAGHSTMLDGIVVAMFILELTWGQRHPR